MYGERECFDQLSFLEIILAPLASPTRERKDSPPIGAPSLWTIRA